MAFEPLVSIICPSYGHERHITETIESFLSQTYRCIEIIVVDDKSPDASIKLVEKIKSSHLKLIRNTFNKGVSCCLNVGIKQAAGSIVTFCASDDVLLPFHVESVVEAFGGDERIGAVYPRLEFVDENDNRTGFANVAVKDRNEILKELFLQGNYSLFAPGSSFRRQVFDRVGFFDPALIQTQDYEFNARLLLEYDFALLDAVTVRYRRSSDSSNLSSGHEWVPICRNLESHVVFNNYLRIDSVEWYNAIFPSKTLGIAPQTSRDIPFCLALQAIWSSRTELMDWGYQRIRESLGSEEDWEHFYTTLGFEYKDYLSLYRTKFAGTEGRTGFVAKNLKRILRKLITLL